MSKYIRALTLTLGLFLMISVVLLAVEPGLPASRAKPLPPGDPTDQKVEMKETSTPFSASATPTVVTAAQPGATLEPVTIFVPITPVTVETPTVLPTQQPTPEPTLASALPPELWKVWPLMPTVSPAMRAAYQKAVAQGTIDPRAFSIFGDCQGEADAFLGVFDNSPGLVETMEDDLQEYVDQFAGSFERYNPAAKSGSSAGSLLFAPWNDNKEGKCTPGETPVDCELRVHHPSIVFIQLGTHFEAPDRNYAYLSTLIQKVMATGAVPVMVTKADNLEKTEFVNLNIAKLADHYGLPLWNFWASVQDLPSHGLQPNGMHLTPEGNVVHQVAALRVLGAVWQAVR